ncbi:hypothetical protein O7047_12150 [Pseudenterobacter timonensis]|uniref:Uncharacterized protein n=1 Tax=Pseudenterobacter timonensis TaxID=1755099 RepID=A0AAE4DNX9_9ENTR|nr:hypothetical protein [Pseudenterobacter timonensis]MDR9890976.1 hypothetical protein [Pseudenterobacter timonensis]
MISPVRQNVFERAANTPALSARELALLLCGLDLRLKTAAIPDDLREYYDVWLYMVTRQIRAAGLQAQGKSRQLYPADEMFALAHLMTDEIITPGPIRVRCLQAVTTIASQNQARNWLMRLGGPPLLELGLTLRRNQRGQYRKTVEQENTDRLLFLLILLLVKNSRGSYGTPESPRLAGIWRDIRTLAECEGLPAEGLSRITIYGKLKSALAISRH